VQEAEGKIAAGLPTPAVLHLVGHLQSNKARAAAALFPWIHSIDSIELLRKLEGAAVRPLDGLVQLKLADEPAKSGCSPELLPRLLEAGAGLARVRLVGLMCVPPATDDPEGARPFFRRLRELRDAHGGEARLPHLSMGMSHDFEVAIEEGATLVRVGELVFGPRRAGPESPADRQRVPSP
jgi:pyridoxal phosphate enzyme (YggS family)